MAMNDHSIEEHLGVWADFVSFVLLCGAIATQGGIDPRRSVWGRSPVRNVLNTLFVGLNIIFSAGRFIAEGVWVETGPREFLLISIIYSARWLWLYAAITKSGSRAARAFEVALELRRLKIIRLGYSTSPTRKKKPELVIRRGARVVSGKHYWRGVEEYVKRSERKETYKVRLVEKELHSDELDEIGTVDFKTKLEANGRLRDTLFKKFYDLLLVVDQVNKDIVLDYSKLLGKYGELSETRQPERVGATDRSEIGNVARRVASDACYYIWNPHGEFRTKDQVDLINDSVERAAGVYMGVPDMGRDEMGREDRPVVCQEKDRSNCDSPAHRKAEALPV